jgi:cytochrome b6-f complex iron-sulfur subunit
MAGRDADSPKPPRREFLDFAISGVAATVGLAAAYPLVRFLEPTPGASASSVVLGPVDEFARGTGRSALLGEQPILVLRASDGSFRAFVAICSHLQCVVRYVAEHDWIECACHGGRFSADGRALAGPPSEPLQALHVEVVDGAVVVSTS